MACTNCFENCAGGATSDKCVQTSLLDIPLLGIKKGDQLNVVEQKVVEALLSALDGTGIKLESVTLANYAWLQALFLGKDKTLAQLMQLIVNSLGSLGELVGSLIPSPESYDVECLTNLPANPSSSDIIKALLALVCPMKNSLDEIPETYVKISDFEDKVKEVIEGDGTEVVQYYLRAFPHSPIPYVGSLANFDNQGKGIATLGFDKMYICNGANGTPDMRGRVVVGAVRNVPGGTPDSAVNPASPVNIGDVNYSIGDKVGENFTALALSNMPPHTHGINDPGHEHSIPTKKDLGSGGPDYAGVNSAGSVNTGKSFTGITVSSAGGGTAHNNRQPSIAAVWIIHIP